MKGRAPGQREAFEALLREHRGIVLKAAALYARSADDRADLEQEIAMQLWRAWPAYDPQRRLSTWMYRIALNVGISHARREVQRYRHFEPLDDILAGSLSASEAQGEDEERLRVLYALIHNLDELNRALLMLYLDDRGYTEIAEILGISETNVATKISRVKQQLRRQIGDAGI